MQSISDQADLWGLETKYVDAAGRDQSISDESVAAVIRILAASGTPPARTILPAVVTVRSGCRAQLDLAGLPPDAAVQWEIADSTSILAAGGSRAGECMLPAILPVGTFKLAVTVNGDAAERHGAILLVAPAGAYQGPDSSSRLWALSVQLYGVRSYKNWGHGDFTDLLALIDLAADVGAAGIGINPLHALFDDRPEQASPYSPNSRLFLNPLYIDLNAVPEFRGQQAIELGRSIDELRQCELVDYSGVAQLKVAALRLAHREFSARRDMARVRDFESFRQERGNSLLKFACFEVLRRRFAGPWWEWPTPWKTPGERDLHDLRRTEHDAVEFYEFVQWVADRQLAACQQRARTRGLQIGLFLDVAVGVDPAGSDAWSHQTTVLRQLSLGAPPDLFNPSGQNWGIAGFSPHGLTNDDFKPFRDTVSASMRHAGAIRIDHVLGLNRLFVIPHDAPARDGVYLRFPLDIMLAVVAQESMANRCITIGEDLGTVPEFLRDTLADWGIWSYRVLMFERNADGSFVAPEDYPPGAIATFGTHDLPTYRGWVTGHDLKVRRDIGLSSGETIEERRASCAALRTALANAGDDREGDFTDVARYLAATTSRLVLIAIEDVLGAVDQPNLPGTINEHPNWRQRLTLPLEDWHQHSKLSRLARVCNESGRMNRREENDGIQAFEG